VSDTITAYRCLECGAISEEVGGRLYECDTCGAFQVDEWVHEGCVGPMRRKADRSCESCYEGEVEEIEVVPINGELVPVDDHDGTEEDDND
jgi:hypothetical protein